MLQRYRQGKVPPRADAMAGHARAAADTALRALDAHELQTALVAIWGLVSEANRYVDQTAPFKIAKDPARSQELDGILYSLAETCRVLAVLLWPFLPGTATRIYAQLGLAGAPNQWSASHWGGLEPGSSLGPIEPLFPRKD
jgi:methionyl-tRNA synthetase